MSSSMRSKTYPLAGDCNRGDLFASGIRRRARLAVHDASARRVRTRARARKPLLDRSRLRPVRHIAASAAAMMWPQTRLDMARFGIALYGLWPSPQTREAMRATPLDLRPASRLLIADRSHAHDCCGRLGRLRRQLSRTDAICASAWFRPAMPTAFRGRSPIAARSPSTARSARSSGASQ